MPRYRVLETSYIADRIHEAGEVVTFDHEPGFNVEPLDDDAKQAMDVVRKRGRVGPNDPGFVSTMIQRNLEGGDAKGVGVVPGSPMGPNGPNAFIVPPAHGPIEATSGLEEAVVRAREEERAAADQERAAAAQGHADEIERLRKRHEEAEARAEEAERLLAEATAQNKPAGKR